MTTSTRQITVRIPTALLDQIPTDRSEAIRQRLDLADTLAEFRAELAEARAEVSAARAEVAAMRAEHQEGQQKAQRAAGQIGQRLEALAAALDRPLRGWLGKWRPEGKSAAAQIKKR